jgi:hypothetical protein
MMSVTSGTSSCANIFDRKADTYFQSSGQNDDTTATTIRVEFAASKSFNRIVLENINWKSFKIYHSSNTANVFTLVNNATTSSDWVTNSETNMFLEFTTVTAAIITLVATTTIVANSEKKCAGLWFLNRAHVFTENPDASGYDPTIKQIKYQHEMSDGGVTVYFVSDTYKSKIKRKYVDTSEYTTLKALYDDDDPLVFIPFPTGTGWDGKIWECNWTNDFEFMQYQHNVKGLGYQGAMTLEETAK